jgi:DNA processing protein
MQLNRLYFWIAMTCVPCIDGPNAIKLLAQLEKPDHLLTLSQQDLRQTGLSDDIARAITQIPKSKIEQCLQWLQQTGHRLIPYQAFNYPRQLCFISAPPAALYVKGNVDLLHQHQLAIVGTRKPTPSGIRTCQGLAYELASNGWVITSGLARGIDGYAHRYTLHANQKTVAVMGCSLERYYPAKHKQLTDDIISHNGALVSEFPIGTAPLPMNFPQRNRIISGLSQGVVVVEASTKSGSLITAGYALDHGRDVFAVPGSIYNHSAAGCHRLIRRGAKLVETVEDILEEYELTKPLTTANARLTDSDNKEIDDLTQLEAQLLNYLGEAPANIEWLIKYSGLTLAQTSQILLQLELKGRVKAVTNGYCRLY